MGQFDNTIGALFIGLLLSAALWGLGCSQTWNYYRDFPKDHPLVKWLVGIAWSTDTAHQILTAHMMYTLLITDFAEPHMLQFIVKSLPISVPIFQVDASCVQLFYAYRIWRLSKQSLFLTVPVVLLIIIQFGFAMGYSVRTMNMVTFVELNERLGTMTIIYTLFDALNDVIITVIMCYLLHTNRSAHNRTNSIINRLIFFTFTSGALTAFSALGLFVARIIVPVSPIYLVFYLVIARFYVNSLLASLNMRSRLAKRDLATSIGDSTKTALHIRTPSGIKDTFALSEHDISVKVDISTEVYKEESNAIYLGDGNSHRKVPDSV